MPGVGKNNTPITEQIAEYQRKISLLGKYVERQS